MNTQLWWYTARSAGIVSWVLLGASVLWGLALSTKAFGRKPRPNWLLDVHRFLGGAGVVFVAVHVVSILLDSYVSFSPVQVLVPFASSWKPLPVAWGIVAMYLLLAVEITSLLRKHLSKRAWRLTHFLSFPLFAVATVHLLTAGTDAGNLVLRLTVAAVCVAVIGLTAYRVARLDSAEGTEAPRPRTPRAARPARGPGAGSPRSTAPRPAPAAATPTTATRPLPGYPTAPPVRADDPFAPPMPPPDVPPAPPTDALPPPPPWAAAPQHQPVR